MQNFAKFIRQTIVVTGASRGIGRQIALELADAGADIVVHYARSTDLALAVCREIEQRGRRAWPIPCDFNNPCNYDAFLKAVWSTADNVYGWVHNAGVDVLTGSAAKLSYGEKLEALLAIDVAGTVLLTKAAGARLREQGGGAIVTIGWDQAARGMEGDSGELFAASKNAIMGFTRSLAMSLAPTVRVNCIAPGWIKTEWGETASQAWQDRVIRETPLQRWGRPEDIAYLARFLLSDQASYLTGQVIMANGGACR